MGLRKYMAKRAIDSSITVAIVLFVNFYICYKNLAEAQGLSETSQFLNYLKFVSVGHFGTTGYTNTLEYLGGLLPYSLFFLALAAIIAVLVGVLLGAYASYRHGSKIDFLLLCVFVLFLMTPTWWSGFFLSTNLSGVFPVSGWHTIYWTSIPFWTNPLGKTLDLLWHLALPVTTLVIGISGIYFIVSRNSMIGTFSEPYITTARAVGFSNRKIVLRQALANAILPIAVATSLAPVFLITATMTVERVYSLWGFGRAIYYSLVTMSEVPRSEILPSLPALFLILSLITIAIHYVMDILHYQLDPRLRRGMNDGGGIKPPINFLSKHRKENMKRVVKSFMKGFSGKLGLMIIAVLLGVALLAPFLPLQNPETYAATSRNLPPSITHLLGTDEWGRDVLSRTIWASRISLSESLGALVVAIGVGTIVGMISGFFREQPVAYLLDRVTDVFLSIPLILVVLFFPIETGSLKWILATGLSTWAIVAKIVRSQVLISREKPYIEAAKALGAGKTRILLNYILPDSMAVIAANMVYVAGLVILIQTSLDFFGFKRFLWSKNPDLPPVVRAPILNWGSMLSYNLGSFLSQNTWWTVLPPIACITLLGISLILIGNKTATILNPQTELGRQNLNL